MLQAVDSPFIRAGDVTWFDLRTALGICMLGFGDSVVRKPWLLLRGRKRLQRAVDAFLGYSNVYLQRPEYSIVPPETKGTPQARFRSAPQILLTASDIIGW